MDAFFSLEELAKKRTSVHALHPAAKLIVTLVFIVCVVSSGRYDVAGLTVYFFYPLVLIALGEDAVQNMFNQERDNAVGAAENYHAKQGDNKMFAIRLEVT